MQKKYTIPKILKDHPFNPFTPNLSNGVGIATANLNPYSWSPDTKAGSAPTGYTLNPDNSYSVDPVFVNDQSLFGKPLVGRLIFNPQANQTFYNYNNLDKLPVTLPSFTIDNCLVTIKQNKKLIKTNVNGRNASVIEYAGLDNYDLDITGTLFSNKNGTAPDISAMVSICEAPISIKVLHDVLNHSFNIDYLFIEEYTIEQEEGGISQQRITISAVSDDPTTYLALFKTN